MKHFANRRAAYVFLKKVADDLGRDYEKKPYEDLAGGSADQQEGSIDSV